MARLARIILPGYPHHITQRGNRNQDVFFCEEDFKFYLNLLKEWCSRESVKIWAYCLMTNHVHLVVTPEEGSNVSRAIGETHRRYTRMINFRQNWRGYLWQGRFSSFVMDESWLLKAVAYVEHNPVAAGIVSQPQHYPWSSIHAHLTGNDSQEIVEVALLLDLVGDWKDYLESYNMGKNKNFETHERTGRPLGNEKFIEKAEKVLGRRIKKKKPGRKHQPLV